MHVCRQHEVVILEECKVQTVARMAVTMMFIFVTYRTAVLIRYDYTSPHGSATRASETVGLSLCSTAGRSLSWEEPLTYLSHLQHENHTNVLRNVASTNQIKHGTSYKNVQ